jgi:hypothetical protein
LDMWAQNHTKGVRYDTCNYGALCTHGKAGSEPYE